IPGQPDTFSFVSAQIRNFLLSFPNNEPDSMLLSGNIVIDPPDRYAAGEIATINDTMHMYASAGIVFPLSVGIYNGLFADTLDIGNSQNGGQTIDPDLLNSLISGKFNFSFKNSIPFDLVLSTTFIRVDSTAIPPVTSVILPPDSVGRVRINASDTALTSTIYLTRSNTSKFGKANKMIVNLSLNTSSGVAALDSTQSVRIRMWGNIVFNVNPDKLKNK
ncbi:MAG TPA: hypothetical protein VKS81_04820, partial [Bacteroidota bacterium]|nr:hypothetical protein [Bacteroidota bacterium]